MVINCNTIPRDESCRSSSEVRVCVCVFAGWQEEISTQSSTASFLLSQMITATAATAGSQRTRICQLRCGAVMNCSNDERTGVGWGGVVKNLSRWDEETSGDFMCSLQRRSLNQIPGVGDSHNKSSFPSRQWFSTSKPAYQHQNAQQLNPSFAGFHHRGCVTFWPHLSSKPSDESLDVI